MSKQDDGSNNNFSSQRERHQEGKFDHLPPMPFPAGLPSVTSLEEDQPTMRSVGITGPRPLLKSLPGPPPKSLGPPTGGILRENVSSKGSVPVGKKVARNGNWTVQPPIEHLPDDFPLERTSRFLPGAEPSLVSSRISSCLRDRNIEAVYDNEKARAKCRTSNFVSFRIRLFSCSNDKGGIVVELQRRRGSSAQFMQDCRAVLEAASGGMSNLTPVKSIPPNMHRPISEMNCLRQVKDEENMEEEIMTDMLKAFKALESIKRDKNMLALEQLCVLTSVEKSCVPRALVASNKLFEDEFAGMLEAITKLLRDGEMRKGDLDYDPTGEGKDDFNERLRNLALVTVTNALTLVHNNGTLKDLFEKRSEWLLEIVVPLLISDIRSAETRPHDACLAAKCLSVLIESSSKARQRSIALGVEEALEGAAVFGKENHSLLAKESESAVELLQSST